MKLAGLLGTLAGVSLAVKVVIVPLVNERVEASRRRQSEERARRRWLWLVDKRRGLLAAEKAQFEFWRNKYPKASVWRGFDHRLGWADVDFMCQSSCKCGDSRRAEAVGYDHTTDGCPVKQVGFASLYRCANCGKSFIEMPTLDIDEWRDLLESYDWRNMNAEEHRKLDEEAGGNM
jgi:hypothetical protein